eukprot:CAMPEP_0173403240 /NCGR_PEP_ID=MMETSP1356-20130122/56262_1 /TAXON_ID=77927 ORGANISM="Hemiselmis virescens, Strain PCC157" /NCGR_SAMPLE_ID=MMETSP1356 /ASSEMBLY_ACC=CAM_ASM_000847 /LENGTH=57 /DNA_ID=CAMNT_0014363739 /DNA_START=8 /DNA_END=181 /DNA_ORIENTATION=+
MNTKLSHDNNSGTTLRRKRYASASTCTTSNIRDQAPQGQGKTTDQALWGQVLAKMPR